MEIKCKACGTNNADNSKFCIKCGIRLPESGSSRTCFHCGNPLQETDLFCDKCGTKQTSINNPVMDEEEPKIRGIYSNTGIIILSILTLILLIAVIIYGIYGSKLKRDIMGISELTIESIIL